jgi:hypothetical protein
MTEAEWLECEDPIAMMGFFGGLVCIRKLRLFSCACCRRLWPLLDNRSRVGVEASERFADGTIQLNTLQAASVGAERAWNDSSAEAQKIFDERGFGDSRANAAIHAADAAYRVMWAEYGGFPFEDAVGVVAYVVWRVLEGTALQLDTQSDDACDHDLWEQRIAAEKKQLVRVLRDIFGNPFRLTFFPSWRTDTALSLARQMYEWRDFGEMPILADGPFAPGSTGSVIVA